MSGCSDIISSQMCQLNDALAHVKLLDSESPDGNQHLHIKWSPLTDDNGDDQHNIASSWRRN